VFTRKELILLGWVAIPGMFITAAMGFADKFLLGRILSLKDVAVYSMAAILSIGIGRVFISALLKPNSISLLRTLQNHDSVGCNSILRRTEWLLCALCVIAALLYYMLAKQVVVAIFGVRFTDSVPIMLALFIAVMIEVMMQIMAQVLVQKRKLYIAVINGGVLLVLAVLLNYIFIPILFIKGAALTFFLCNLIALIVVYFQIKNLVEWIMFPRWLVPISSSIFLFSFFVPAT
jgi:O-antigen/teichoic acid export membrane protein